MTASQLMTASPCANNQSSDTGSGDPTLRPQRARGEPEPGVDGHGRLVIRRRGPQRVHWGHGGDGGLRRARGGFPEAMMTRERTSIYR